MSLFQTVEDIARPGGGLVAFRVAEAFAEQDRARMAWLNRVIKETSRCRYCGRDLYDREPQQRQPGRPSNVCSYRPCLDRADADRAAVIAGRRARRAAAVEAARASRKVERARAAAARRLKRAAERAAAVEARRAERAAAVEARRAEREAERIARRVQSRPPPAPREPRILSLDPDPRPVTVLVSSNPHLPGSRPAALFDTLTRTGTVGSFAAAVGPGAARRYLDAAAYRGIVRVGPS